MFNGYFVHALNQSFARLFPNWAIRGPVIGSAETSAYADHGRMYLMGPMSAVYEPPR